MAWSTTPGGGDGQGARTSSNSFGHHRRAISHGDSSIASPSGTQPIDTTNHQHPQHHYASLGLPLPPHLQGKSLHGQTPSYELTSDPLAANTVGTPVPSATTQRHRTPHQSQPSTTSVSVIPPTPTNNLPSRNPPQKAKTIQVDTAAASASWKRRHVTDEDGFKRPTSPHITTATPTSAYHHSRALSPYDPSSSRTATPILRSPSMGHDPTPRSNTPGAPKRQGSLSRAAAAAQQMFAAGASVARASPVMFRTPNRANSRDPDDAGGSGSGSGGADRNGSSAFDDDDGADEDDEAGKGHGKRHNLHRRSFTSATHRWGASSTAPHHHPRKQASDSSPTTTLPRASSRAASRGASHHNDAAYDGRKTPAKYRPVPSAAKSHSAEVPASHDVNGWSSHHPHSSISIGSTNSLDSDKATASPLIVPQARRGAINLKSCPGRGSKTQRKLRAQRRRLRQQRSLRRASHGPSRSFVESLFSNLSTLLFHIMHPIHTARIIMSSLCSTLHSVDLAFREPPQENGRRTWWPEWIGAYIPLLIWLGVSVTSTVVVLIFHTQVFTALDQLSRTLQGLGFTGRLLLGSLIFLTTFPPLPLYSTLIVLCGFSFGLWQGFVISYIAALSGAIVVYLLSKSLLRGWMTSLLQKSGGLKKVVRAIEKRPKLLFLIRLAPYPYNLMNTLLASSPTLTFKTYVTCTALALPKLLVHCGLGTSIKNFAAYHGAGTDAVPSTLNGTSQAPSAGSAAASTSTSHTAESIKKAAGVLGVGLCIGIFLYLFSVARKAVDEELDDESGEERAVMQSRSRLSGSQQSRGGADYDALEMLPDGNEDEKDGSLHEEDDEEDDLLTSEDDGGDDDSNTVDSRDEEPLTNSYGLYTHSHPSSFSPTDLDPIASSRERSLEKQDATQGSTIKVNEIEALAAAAPSQLHHHDWAQSFEPRSVVSPAQPRTSPFSEMHFRIASPDQADEGEVFLRSEGDQSQTWLGGRGGMSASLSGGPSSTSAVGDDPYRHGLRLSDAHGHTHSRPFFPPSSDAEPPAKGRLDPAVHMSHSSSNGSIR